MREVPLFLKSGHIWEHLAEVGHDAHLRYSHMTLVYNYAATHLKE